MSSTKLKVVSLKRPIQWRKLASLTKKKRGHKLTTGKYFCKLGVRKAFLLKIPTPGALGRFDT